MKRVFLALLVFAGLLPPASRAAVVTLTSYTGPSNWVSSAEVNTVNAFAVSNGGGSLTGLRYLEQSFTLTRTLRVESIYLAVQNYDPGPNYTISFHQIGGSGANSTSLNDWDTTSPSYTGGQVGNTISTFTGDPASVQTGNRVLRINLTPAEQITLATGQYLIVLRDTTNTTPSFTWVHSNDSSTNHYAGGRFFASSNGIVSQASYRDFGLALAGTASDTPTINPPSRLTVLTGDARALLRWVAPTASGISDYLVEYRTLPSGMWTVFPHAASTATSIAVTGLTNATTYDFQVSAVTSSMTSSPSLGATGKPEIKTFLHIFSAGQSLSVGGTATPILSNTQPYDNMMLASSPAGVNLPLVPLVEAEARPGLVETPSSGMANLLRGSDLASPRPVVVGLHGLSGTAYSGLKKGAPVPNNETYAPYAKGMVQAQNTKTYVENTLGCTYLPLAVTVIHGEQDYVLGLTNSYDSNLVQWQADYENDIATLTGVHRTIPFFINQMNSGNTGEMAVTQFNAHRLHDGKIYLVGPKYQYRTNDGTHLTNTTSKAAGEMLGKVIKKVMLDGQDWDPLMPTVVVGSSNVITVSYRIPVGTLVLDTTLVAQRPNYGFEFTQTGGNSVSINSVQLINSNTQVKVTLSASPTGTNRRLRYGWGNPVRTNSDLKIGYADASNGSSAGGNIRDQDNTVSPSPTGTGLPLYNWSIAFDEPVLSPAEAWRQLYFGTAENLGNAADSADPDGDGTINGDEFVAGTHPKDATDVLRAAVSPVASGSGFTVQFTAKANISYVIEYKNSLSDPAWQTLPGATYQKASNTVIEHTDVTTEPRRFYRVRIPGL